MMSWHFSTSVESRFRTVGYNLPPCPGDFFFTKRLRRVQCIALFLSLQYRASEPTFDGLDHLNIPLTPPNSPRSTWISPPRLSPSPRKDRLVALFDENIPAESAHMPIKPYSCGSLGPNFFWVSRTEFSPGLSDRICTGSPGSRCYFSHPLVEKIAWWHFSTKIPHPKQRICL